MKSIYKFKVLKVGKRDLYRDKAVYLVRYRGSCHYPSSSSSSSSSSASSCCCCWYLTCVCCWMCAVQSSKLGGFHGGSICDRG